MKSTTTPKVVKSATILALGAALLFAAAVTVAQQTGGPATKADAGPATINVSSYPGPVQGNYRLFMQKCSQCHTIARAINSDYVLPDEWERYIKRMLRKPGSGMSSADGKKIYDFLVYDAGVRKKRLLDQKLAQLSPAEKKAAEAKIQEVTAKYR